MTDVKGIGGYPSRPVDRGTDPLWQPIETMPLDLDGLVALKSGNDWIACSPEVFKLGLYDATHWMPLPTPPEDV